MTDHPDDPARVDDAALEALLADALTDRAGGPIAAEVPGPDDRLVAIEAEVAVDARSCRPVILAVAAAASSWCCSASSPSVRNRGRPAGPAGRDHDHDRRTRAARERPAGIGPGLGGRGARHRQPVRPRRSDVDHLHDHARLPHRRRRPPQLHVPEHGVLGERLGPERPDARHELHPGRRHGRHRRNHQRLPTGYVAWIADVIHGDVTGDGEDDAVRLMCGLDQSDGVWESIAVVSVVDGTPTVIGSLDRSGYAPMQTFTDPETGDEREYPENEVIVDVNAAGGQLAVRWNRTPRMDPFAAQHLSTVRYRWDGSSFVPQGETDVEDIPAPSTDVVPVEEIDFSSIWLDMQHIRPIENTVCGHAYREHRRRQLPAGRLVGAGGRRHPRPGGDGDDGAAVLRRPRPRWRVGGPRAIHLRGPASNGPHAGDLRGGPVWQRRAALDDDRRGRHVRRRHRLRGGRVVRVRPAGHVPILVRDTR